MSALKLRMEQWGIWRRKREMDASPGSLMDQAGQTRVQTGIVANPTLAHVMALCGESRREFETERAVSELTGKLRSLMILRYVESESFAVIAERLKLASESAARMRHQRGMERIRSILQGMREARVK